jgi:hypothetical protein
MVITATSVVEKSGSSRRVSGTIRPSRRLRVLNPLQRSVRRTFRGGGRKSASAIRSGLLGCLLLQPVSIPPRSHQHLLHTHYTLHSPFLHQINTMQKVVKTSSDRTGFPLYRDTRGSNLECVFLDDE